MTLPALHAKTKPSDKVSRYTRKYVLGVLFTFIAIVLLRKSGISVKVFALVLFALGLFYLLRRTMKFDNHFVYKASKRSAFNKIEKLSAKEVNQFIFPYIVIKDNGRRRINVTDVGQAGILKILVGILIPALAPLKQIKKFKEHLDQSQKSRINTHTK
jgi:hypothetical protein